MDDLIELENKRCVAITAGDTAALSALLSDDYTHIHATGRLDDKAGYMEGTAKRPRKTARSNLNVRVYGDAAVLIGDQTNEFDDGRVVNGCAQSVAVRRNGAWIFVAGQLTRREK